MQRVTVFVVLSFFFFASCASTKSKPVDLLAEATALSGKAVELQETGKYDKAIDCAKRSLEIREIVLGKDHVDTARSLDQLGFLYRETAQYSEAEPLCNQALEIRQRLLGKDHPDVATSLDHLGELYLAMFRYAEAEPLYKRALEIREAFLGKNHADTATSLDHLAFLYQETTRYAEAEPLHKKALELREQALGKNHPDVATSLHNLGLLYWEIGRYSEAERLLERALEIRKNTFGENHPTFEENLNDLALVVEDIGRHAEAEVMYKRSIEITERVLGKDHPHLADSLHNLAALYLYKMPDRWSDAEPLYKRSLEICERLLGEDSPDIAITLNDLGLFYAVTGRHPESHRMYGRTIKIEEGKKENIFSLLSERQKLNFLEKNKKAIYEFVSHTARYLAADNQAMVDTLNAWIRWKGSVMEAQGRFVNALIHSANSEVKKKLNELNSIRRESVQLQLSWREKMSPEEYRERLEKLSQKKETLELELSRLSRDFALDRVAGRADVKSISDLLLSRSEDWVYIDFAAINICDFEQRKLGESKYLAFTLVPASDPTVRLLEISGVESVDAHIRDYLGEMGRVKEYGELPRERVLRAEVKALYDILIKPLEPYLRGKRYLYISPDSKLNLIPFEVLITPDGKYLMEDYSITYVAAGRDIMRFTDTSVGKGPPVIMADPDFDLGLEEKIQVAKAMGVIETRSPAPLSRDAKDLRFRRLPDTKQEADTIEKVLEESYQAEVKNYQDKKALEEVLFEVEEPRILHLATHGYFLRDGEIKVPGNLGLLSLGKDTFIDPGIENPMLRSGIVLAGANASLKEGRDDGVVSAEKILGLRLKGTDLVVLSACETGVGDVKSGEGVFGLKRSFILSGAKTVVMSLWSIPSRETTELMTDFYTLMAKGKTKAEALREARLNMMKKKSNPFYWGAFVMVGNPN